MKDICYKKLVRSRLKWAGHMERMEDGKQREQMWKEKAVRKTEIAKGELH